MLFILMKHRFIIQSKQYREVMGNRGIMSFISGETGEFKSKNEGNRGTNVILGSKEHKIRF